MAERYSISNRKNNPNNKEYAKAAKASGKSNLYSSSSLSVNTVLIASAVILLITNITTLTITTVVLRNKINQLNNELKDVKTQLDKYKQKFGDLNANINARNKVTAPQTGIVVPSTTQSAIQSALNAYLASGGTNQAALQSALANRLSPSVIFAIAGSSATQQTVAQAIASLNYIKGANGTWNWNLTPEQLTPYQTGQYAQYFGDNSIIGQSSNGYIVSLTVDATGNVTNIFVSSSIEVVSTPPGSSE
ncbi:hypothetical protein H0W80_02925 [Candidatus Saccharibacteria bacterium]|nr:hypothetical protein [Candidatus Saccharibacteria bacterium]